MLSMVMNRIPNQPGLRQIYPCPRPDAKDIDDESFDDCVLVVPSLSYESNSFQAEWPCSGNDSWVHKLASLLSAKPGLLFFEHRLKYADLKDWKGWQPLLAVAELLAGKLELLLTSSIKRRPRRLIILAHGFGGFIIKKALNDLAESATGTASLTSLKALIMISCPHLTANNKGSWKNVTSMLLAGTSKIAEELKPLEKLEILKEVCTTYDAHSADFDAETMRLYESRATELRAKATKFGQTKEVVLVDRSLAGDTQDDCPSIKVPADHQDILFLHNHVAELQEVVDFVARFKTSPAKHESFSSQKSFGSPAGQIPHFIHHQQLPLYLNKPEAELKDFYGREDLLQQIEMKLCRDRLDPPPTSGLLGIVLHGLGGIGKSSLASRFVDVCRDKKLFDLIIWIRAKNRTTIVQDLAAAVRPLHLRDGETVDLENDWKTTLTWLQNPVSHTRTSPASPSSSLEWLIVFDDAHDAHMVKDFIPASHKGSILITTRDPNIASEVELLDPDLFIGCTPSRNGLRVEKFDSEESVLFLEKLTGSNDKSSLRFVASELDGIPVALRCMGEMMKKMTPSEFVKTYQEPANLKRLFNFKLKHHQMCHATNVADAWGLDRLDVGVDLMNVISLLDPASIREDILKQAQEWDSAKFDNDYPTQMLDYTMARDELKRLSLVSHDKESETIAIARVIQATVRSNMARDALVKAFNCACLLLLQSWPRTGDPNGKVWKNNPRDTWQLCDGVRCHVDRLIQHYEHLKKAGWQDDVSTEDFCWLLIYSGWFDHDRGKSESAERIFELAHEICHRLSGPDDSEIQAEIHACRGAIATEVNDAKNCIEHYEKFFKLTTQRYDAHTASNQEARVNMAIAWNEYGVARMMKDHIDGESGAYDAFEKARRVLMDDLGADDERILLTWGLATINLSVVSWERNQLRHAIRLLDDLVSKLNENRFWKKDALVYGRIFHAYGNAYESQGNHEKAKEYHGKAFSRHKETLGEEHHRTADVAMRMAQHAQRNGEYESSHEYLADARKVFDSKKYYRPERARCLQFKSALLAQEGKEEEARQVQKEAESLFNEVLKERQGYEQDSPIMASSFDRLVTFWSR